MPDTDSFQEDCLFYYFSDNLVDYHKLKQFSLLVEFVITVFLIYLIGFLRSNSTKNFFNKVIKGDKNERLL